MLHHCKRFYILLFGSLLALQVQLEMWAFRHVNISRCDYGELSILLEQWTIHMTTVFFLFSYDRWLICATFSWLSRLLMFLNQLLENWAIALLSNHSTFCIIILSKLLWFGLLRTSTQEVTSLCWCSRTALFTLLWILTIWSSSYCFHHWNQNLDFWSILFFGLW